MEAEFEPGTLKVDMIQQYVFSTFPGTPSGPKQLMVGPGGRGLWNWHMIGGELLTNRDMIGGELLTNHDMMEGSC